MASFELEPGLREMSLKGLSGCDFRESGWFDGYSYIYFGGDFNHHIYLRDGKYCVTDTHRDSRDLVSEFKSPHLELAEKWLLVKIGPIYRSVMGIPEIELPFLRPQIKVGYSICGIGAGFFTLSGPGGLFLPFELYDWDERPTNCVRYSHVVDLPLPGLIESYRSETGAPFLRDYVVSQGEV